MSLESDGRTARAEAKRLQRVADIEAAAAELISERGFHATSVSDVIDAAGISRGTFYLYFESKEVLFLELVGRFLSHITNAIRVVDPDGSAPAVEILLNLRRVVDVVFDNPNLTRLVFQQSVGINDEVDAKLRQLYGFLEEMVEGALVNGAAVGITREVNAPLVATALIGAMKEVFHRFLVNGFTVDVNREEIARELLEFGMSGLRVS